jgi:hypothetical protein
MTRSSPSRWFVAPSSKMRTVGTGVIRGIATIGVCLMASRMSP